MGKNTNKKIMTIATIAMIAIGIPAMAALLSYYGSITGTATVSQSVLVDGENVNTGSLTLNDTGQVHILKNNAGMEAPISFETKCDKSGIYDGQTLTNATMINWTSSCKGITTRYVGVLELTKKDTSNWNPVGNKTKIWYTLSGTEFEWGFIDNPDGIVMGNNSGEYTLIYYKDATIELGERLENPQPAIIVTRDIGNLPQSNDANLDKNAGYCGEPDHYEHCTGAKLWIVPTNDITGSALNWSDEDNFYFETDLITYSANPDEKITLPANGGGINFKIINDFNVALTPDTYTITTNIVPK